MGCVKEENSICHKGFEAMEGEVACGLQTYNEMMKGFCLVGAVEKAMVLFHRLLMSGPPPNQITYNTIIYGYCKIGNHNNAIRMVYLMKENGHKPDEWTYTELICGFCKGGQLDLACKALEVMAEQGLRLNVVTYTTLIDGYSKEGKLDIALSLFNNMEENGCKPNLQTFNAIISGFAKQNQLAEAEKLCSEMVQRGLLPNVVTYTSLINGLSKNGATSVAMRVMDEMVEQGCSPNLHTYSALIHGLCQEGKAQEAEKMFLEMEDRGLVPDEVTYTSMMDGWIMVGRVDDAFSLLKRMVTTGNKPNYWMYSVLMKGLWKEQQLTAKKLAAVPNAVSTCSIDEKATSVDIFSSLLMRLPEYGYELNINEYRTLVCGLCGEGRWSEADQVVKSMAVQGLPLDEEIYNSLLQVYANNLKIEHALELLNAMTSIGFEPCLMGYKSLICALCEVDRVQEAQNLFHCMLLQHWSPDEVVWTILIDGLIKGGKPTLCTEFLQIMEAKGCKPTLHTHAILARELSAKDKSSKTSIVEILET
ncbi:unnamed protein product [Musa acuminata var. zebrina]